MTSVATMLLMLRVAGSVQQPATRGRLKHFCTFKSCHFFYSVQAKQFFFFASVPCFMHSKCTTQVKVFSSLPAVPAFNVTGWIRACVTELQWP